MSKRKIVERVVYVRSGQNEKLIEQKSFWNNWNNGTDDQIETLEILATRIGGKLEKTEYIRSGFGGSQEIVYIRID